MKKVEAIVRKSKLASVKAALEQIQVRGMTVADVRGAGDEDGAEFCYRGVTARQELVPRTKVEMIVADSEVDSIVDTVFQAARTGEIGDGEILVTPVESVTRIRTGEIDGADTIGTDSQQTLPRVTADESRDKRGWTGLTVGRGNYAPLDYWTPHVRP